MGRAVVPFPRDHTVRRPVGVSDVVRPRCLSSLFVRPSALEYLISRRPGVCGRADVGLGHVCLSGSGSRGHNPHSLAAAARFECGGCMNITTTAGQPCPARSAAAIADYWALTKPEINFLIAIVTFAGFYLGLPAELHGFPFLPLIHTLLGTLLISSGASALNQFSERRFDARMRRTARRPLAAGKLEPASALRFGLLLALAGAIYLAVAVNVLASLLAVITLASYLVLYTPLKRKTPWCTVAGAFPGAMPPLIGWAAASGGLTSEAWVLYVILFLWQFPHFMAIAWMYRDDYARAGYLVLPRGEHAAVFMAGYRRYRFQRSVFACPRSARDLLLDLVLGPVPGAGRTRRLR